MKNILSLLLTLLIFSSFSNAQLRYQRTFGEVNDENAYTITKLTDGYLLSGFTLSYGLTYSDIIVVRTDLNGDTLWTKLYGGAGEEICYTSLQTLDGGFIFVGYTNSFGAGNWDVYLIKTDESGNVQWSKTYGGGNYETASMIRQLPDSGYIVAGYTNSYGNGTYDAYAIRTDVYGDTLWTRTYGGGNWDWFNVVEQTTDGNLVFCGTTMSFGQGNMEAWLLRTNMAGDTIWTKAYGKSGADDAYALQVLPDSGYMISGITNSSGAGGADAFVIRTDNSGDTVWCKAYGGTGDDRAYASVLSDNTNLIVAGLTKSFGGGLSDLYLFKINLNGDTVFTKTLGGAQDDWGNQIYELTNGDLVISGINASSGAGGNDLFFLMTDSMGNSGGCTEYNTTTKTNPAPFVINTNAANIGTGAVVGNPSTLTISHGVQVDVQCIECDSVSVSFSFTDSSSTVQFIDYSSGGTSWHWDFGDGDTSALQNPVHTYLSDSTYYVCLTASNNCSVDSFCDSVSICALPVALFSWTQDTVLSIQFSDSSIGATSWFWDFGDGDTSSQQNPYHTYTSEGWYFICLYVTDGNCSDSICDSIYVLGNSINDLNSMLNFQLIPNPNNGNFEIALLSEYSCDAMIRIFQTDGRIVKQFNIYISSGDNSEYISLDNIAGGRYLFELSDSRGKEIRKLIIK